MTSGPRRRILLALHWYLESLHEGALRYANEQGWELHRVTESNADAIEASCFDGILSAAPAGDRPLYRLIAGAKLPVVELSYLHPAETGWCRYVSDHEGAGQLAAEYLRRLGVASFSFVADASNRTHDTRWAAFSDTLADDPRRCVRFDRDGRPASALSEVLKKQAGPVGIFGSVDDCALYALRAAEEARLKVPGDVFILGMGDRRLVSGMASVPISSIAIDYAAWAYAAMGLLHERIESRVPPGTERKFPVGEVIGRRSTDDDNAPPVARALKLMRAHVETPLSVKELADALGVSESTLRRAFSDSGESVAARYLSIRLSVAGGLLVAGLKVEAVAASVGFASARAFTQAFKKETGESPGAYRRKRMRGT